MVYQVKPLTDFMKRVEYTPLSRAEYEARARPFTAAEPLQADKVDLSTRSGREALVRQITSRLGPASPKSLINSLTPSEKNLGASYGLYAGVGEVPYYKMRPLISRYV